MDTTAQIGPSIHIRGQITAREPLTIAGRVDGTIEALRGEIFADMGGSVAERMESRNACDVPFSV